MSVVYIKSQPRTLWKHGPTFVIYLHQKPLVKKSQVNQGHPVLKSLMTKAMEHAQFLLTA